MSVLSPTFILKKIKENKVIKKILNHKKIYKTYDDAIKKCTKNAYEYDELIEVIYKKTESIKYEDNKEITSIWSSSAYSMLSLINPIIGSTTNEIKVLDFGGACGAHYFQIKSILDKKMKINWAVVETANMVKKAKCFENDELSFFDNLYNATCKLKKIDLVHSSGTLQFTNNPDYFLDLLINCNAKWLFLNRLALNKENNDIVTIHKSKLSWNGIGKLPSGFKEKWIKYPCTFVSEKKFLQKIEKNYTIVAKVDDKSGMFEINGQNILGYGILCRLKD